VEEEALKVTKKILKEFCCNKTFFMIYCIT